MVTTYTKVNTNMENKMSLFEELRQDETLCDTVLQVNGTQFKVHKLVLCSCSAYFKALFTDCSSLECSVINITDLSADILRTFLKFAYTRVVTVTEDNVFELFYAADCYGISGITQECCKLLEEKLNPRNCIKTWWLSNNYYYPELRQKVFFYILRHFEKVLECSEDFLKLSLADLYHIIENDQLSVREEKTVFEAILHWISYSPDSRKKHISQLFPKIRLALVNYEYLTEHVMTNELVKENSGCIALLMTSTHFMLGNQTQRLSPSFLPSGQARPRVPQALLMAIGGWRCGNPINSIEVYDNCANCWVAVTNADNTPRAYHGTVFLNGSVYCIGGCDSVNHFSTMHKYDLVNRTWQEVAPMHSVRCFLSVVLLDGFIYAIGGYDGVDGLETAERYAPQTNQWTMIGPMFEPRSDASSTSFDGKIYICGGFNGFQCLSTAEHYNPRTDQWTQLADMSCPRCGIGVIAYANKIYAVGGYNGRNRVDIVEAYNPETDRWHLAPSMKMPRSNFGIEVLDGCLYVVGGFSGYSHTRDVESYDVKCGVWTDVPHMEKSRSALSCCVVYDLPNMADYTAPRSRLC